MIGIGDFDGKSRRRKEVRTREDQVMWMGRKYRRDKKSGYYICTTLDEKGKRKRLHVAVWEAYWGREVPRGCVIHHLDWNKSNNNIENLICVWVWEHEAIHNPSKAKGSEGSVGIEGSVGGREWAYELIKTRVQGVPPDCDVDESERKKCE